MTESEHDRERRLHDAALTKALGQPPPPPTEDEARYRGFLTDFALIRDFVPWVHQAHAAQLAFLQANVRAGDVVVTHHLPHPNSTPAMFADSPLNRFFVSGDARGVLERAGARLWLHGHTHSPREKV